MLPELLHETHQMDGGRIEWPNDLPEEGHITQLYDLLDIQRLPVPTPPEGGHHEVIPYYSNHRALQGRRMDRKEWGNYLCWGILGLVLRADSRKSTTIHRRMWT